MLKNDEIAAGLFSLASTLSGDENDALDALNHNYSAASGNYDDLRTQMYAGQAKVDQADAAGLNATINVAYNYFHEWDEACGSDRSHGYCVYTPMPSRIDPGTSTSGGTDKASILHDTAGFLMDRTITAAFQSTTSQYLAMKAEGVAAAERSKGALDKHTWDTNNIEFQRKARHLG